MYWKDVIIVTRCPTVLLEPLQSDQVVPVLSGVLSHGGYIWQMFPSRTDSASQSLTDAADGKKFDNEVEIF